MNNRLVEAESLLIGDIYDAALEPSIWPRVLANLTALSESNSAIITALDQLNPDYTLVFTHNIPEEPLRVYREAGLDALEMEFHGGPMIRAGMGSTVLSTEMYGTQADYIREGGDFYRRCLKPSNIHYLAATLLDHGNFRWGALGIHRPEHWAPFTRDEAALLGRLSPHIRRSLQIHRQLSAVEQQNATLYRMLEGLNVGVLLLNQHGQVCHANPQAEQLLRQHSDTLRVTLREGLRASRPDQNMLLQRLIRAAIDTGRRTAGPDGNGGVIGLQQATRGHPLMLTIAPLSELAGYRELTSDSIAAAIFLTDPDARHLLSRKLLKSAYALTERECDICESFVNTATLETTASACGISLTSLRTYMKSIYAKTGHHSQAELMRLLMGLKMEFEHIRH
ncbi:MAG: PAS domain-containing protein [Pseudomonadota bacterium]